MIVAVAFLVGAWGVGVPVAWALAHPAGLTLLGLWAGSACGYAAVTAICAVVVARSDWAALAAVARNKAEVSAAGGSSSSSSSSSDSESESESDGGGDEDSRRNSNSYSISREDQGILVARAVNSANNINYSSNSSSVGASDDAV